MEENSQVTTHLTKPAQENSDSAKIIIKDSNVKFKSSNMIPFWFLKGYPVFVIGPHCKNYR
jgi:hypothetical protein